MNPSWPSCSLTSAPIEDTTSYIELRQSIDNRPTTNCGNSSATPRWNFQKMHRRPTAAVGIYFVKWGSEYRWRPKLCYIRRPITEWQETTSSEQTEIPILKHFSLPGLRCHTPTQFYLLLAPSFVIFVILSDAYVLLNLYLPSIRYSANCQLAGGDSHLAVRLLLWLEGSTRAGWW